MWLLNATTLKLESFFGPDVPKYMILSHTWEDEEVTFQDIIHDTGSSKKGYAKIVQACKETLRDKFAYTWIDTCAIDKTSSAELTESINSMFQWYQKAEICYMYLSDLRSGVAPGDQEGFTQCRWFTRGWTLQELIAPQKIYFFDENWEYVGSKRRRLKILSSITRIDEDILLGYGSLKHYSVATRMSWAAHRQTTRIKDSAYCLLGIFDVNMPLIYGEGSKAFRRLQEEVVKSSNDLTVFAWYENEGEGVQHGGLFATSPMAFARSNGMQRFGRSEVNPVFSMMNKGLRVEEYNAMFKETTKTKDGHFEVIGYSLLVGFDFSSQDFCVPLSKVGPDIYVRSGNLLAKIRRDDDYTLVSVETFYIHPDGFDSSHSEGKASILHISREKGLRIQEAIPQSHWDDSRQFFF